MTCIEIKECRICHSSALIDVLDLGIHSLSGRFPAVHESDPPQFPLVLTKCTQKECGLLQLKHSVHAEELYCHTYGYRSGLNRTMTDHLASLAQEIENRCEIQENDIILDIGSNDATLLKSYSKKDKVRKIGIDPTGNQFRSFYSLDIQLVPDFFSASTFHSIFPTEKARVVTSISMFYDLPDPVGFAKDISSILSEDGIWVTEQSYMPTMLEMNSFDTVCHEHLEYYALKQISYIAEKANLKLIDVSLNSCNGGSFRITMAHKNSDLKENTQIIQTFYKKEHQLQLDSIDTYRAFEERCKVEKRRFMSFIENQVHYGKKIGIYGASTKGNTLLQYYGLTSDKIIGASERNPEKYGRRTPKTNIPIMSEQDMRKVKPDYLIVLPWHFKEEFLEREKRYLEEGGQFIFPLPHVSIVSNRKKILVTGIDGQLGTYLHSVLKKEDSIIYGITRRAIHPNIHSDVHYMNHDFSSDKHFDDILHTIEPQEIYHLAAETDATVSSTNIVPCFQLNALVVAQLCGYLLQHKYCKLIVANSSEIYKGLGQVNIDNDNKYTVYPKNPYAIAKLTAYWICEYYREQFGLWISNAFIFNCESPLRRDAYVAKKITNFVKKIKETKENNILHLGNIDTFRPWMHAYDVARAFVIIMKQTNGNDYFICSDKLHSIREFIEVSFKKIDVEIQWNNYIGVDRNTSIPCVQYDPSLLRSYESEQEKIIGDSGSLRRLGWSPIYNFEDIIWDLLR